jgi:hypothetical protein
VRAIIQPKGKNLESAAEKQVQPALPHPVEGTTVKDGLGNP